MVDVIFLVVMCVFFKQKTAYEMRISDWSSDVCSSDLLDGEWKYRGTLTWDFVEACKKHCGLPVMVKSIATREDAEIALARGIDVIWVSNHGRSEERRVG